MQATPRAIGSPPEQCLRPGGDEGDGSPERSAHLWKAAPRGHGPCPHRLPSLPCPPATAPERDPTHSYAPFAGGPPGLPHLALVRLLLLGAEVDRRQTGQVEGAARVRARDRPQQEQQQQQQPRPRQGRRRGRPGAHAGGCERTAAEPRGTTRAEGAGGSEITCRPKRGEGRPATASSGCAPRRRGPRDGNRSGPPRSMRGAACTCPVRAPPAQRAVSGRGGTGEEIRVPDFQLSGWGDFRLRASGAHGPVSESHLALLGRSARD